MAQHGNPDAGPRGAATHASGRRTTRDQEHHTICCLRRSGNGSLTRA